MTSKLCVLCVQTYIYVNALYMNYLLLIKQIVAKVSMEEFP